MGLRRVALVTAFSLLAAVGCNGGIEDVESNGDVPLWIRDGVQLARDTKAAWDADRVGGGRPSVSFNTPVAAVSGRLPDRGAVVAGLASVGLSSAEANCMYDNLAANSDASDAAATVLNLVSAATADGQMTPDSVASLANFDPQTVNRVLFSFVPCLSPESLTTLVLAIQPDAAAALSGGPFSIGGVTNIDTVALQRALASVDIGALATAAAGALGGDQVGALTEVLLASLLSTGDISAILRDPLSILRLDQLDLRSLPPDQAILIVLAIARGLTESQRGQLIEIAETRLDELNIDIDPEQLTIEQIGGLLLILAPAIAGALTDGYPPPPGWDPNQIYIPDGTDLSYLNPLLFINRDAFAAELRKEGIDPKFGMCIFDTLRNLRPDELLALFTTTSNVPALLIVVVRSLGCVL